MDIRTQKNGNFYCTSGISPSEYITFRLDKVWKFSSGELQGNLRQEYQWKVSVFDLSVNVIAT